MSGIRPEDAAAVIDFRTEVTDQVQDRCDRGFNGCLLKSVDVDVSAVGDAAVFEVSAVNCDGECGLSPYSRRLAVDAALAKGFEQYRGPGEEA